MALLYALLTAASLCCSYAAYADDETTQTVSPTGWLKAYRPPAALEDDEKYKLKTTINIQDLDGVDINKDKDKFVKPEPVRDINGGEKMMRFKLKIDPTAERKTEEVPTFMKKDEIDKLSGDSLHKDE